MFLAGVSFLLHYQVVTRRDFRIAFRNKELRFYVWIVALSSAFLVLMLSGNGMETPEVSYQQYRHDPGTPEEFASYVAAEAERFNSVESSIRHSVFQVLAIVTGTGFGTADFDVWPRSVGFLLVVLMFFGACAGSTSGGMKLIRIMVAAKAAWREVKKVVRPHLIAPVKIEREAVPETMISNITGFILLFFGLLALASWGMTFFVTDLTTAIVSVIATLANIGPGLSGVGPNECYGWIPIGGKWILILCMLLGRLEVFTVLVMLRASFWRR